MARWTSTAWSFRRPLSRRSPCRLFLALRLSPAGAISGWKALFGRPPDSASQLQLQLIANPDRVRVRRSKQRVRGLEWYNRCSSERWQSGRSHPPRKRAYLNGYREFESPPLRHPSRSPFSHQTEPVPARRVRRRRVSASIGQCPKVNRRLAVSDQCRRAILP